MYLIIFLGIPLLIALVLIKLAMNRKENKYDKFLAAMKAGAMEAAPETAGFNVAMARGAKDTVSTVEGYSSLVEGGNTIPGFIVSYRGDEMYILSIGSAAPDSVKVNPGFILHITCDRLEEVTFGPMGKTTFCFKDSGRIFSMTVTEYALPMVLQEMANQEFKDYIREFAKRVNG